MKAEVAAATAGIDAYLTPGTTGGAPAIADIDQSTTPAVYTRMVNLLDWCALVVPCGQTGGGLPLSLQIACVGGAEAMALRVGHAYQRVTRWHEANPSL